MDRELLFGVQPLTTTIRNYRIVRNGYIVTLSNMSGAPLGRITLSPSGEQRGALWVRDSLVGEFEYFQKKWFVYAIENGQIASQALHADPLEYMIERFERGRSLTSNGRRSYGKAAAAV